MIFNNKKSNPFINGKIVQHNNDVSNRMAILDNLMGSYGEASGIKQKFLQMIVCKSTGT